MNSWSFASKAIHAGFGQDAKTGATCLPIYESSAFAYSTAQELADVFAGRKFGYIYSRIANPTVSALEERLNALEDGLGALATASGMAAIATAILALVNTGEEMVSSKSLFGGTFQFFEQLLQKNGIVVRYVDTMDVAAYEAAITPKTRLIFVESMGNPKLDIPPIPEIVALANVHNIPVIVDATVSTPYLFSAKKWGVAIVVHSLTKYISGGGHTIGGALVDLGQFDWTKCRSQEIRKISEKAGKLAFLARARKQILQNTGSCLAPFSAYMIHSGIETLPLRMDKHCANAGALAGFLADHPKVTGVHYPGLSSSPYYTQSKKLFSAPGGLLTLRVGSQEGAFRVIDALKLAKNLANLGDVRTLVIHPASTIYRDFSGKSQIEAGVYPDLIRVSVGIEGIEDIISDFESALGEV